MRWFLYSHSIATVPPRLRKPIENRSQRRRTFHWCKCPSTHCVIPSQFLLAENCNVTITIVNCHTSTAARFAYVANRSFSEAVGANSRSANSLVVRFKAFALSLRLNRVENWRCWVPAGNSYNFFLNCESSCDQNFEPEITLTRTPFNGDISKRNDQTKKALETNSGVIFAPCTSWTTHRQISNQLIIYYLLFEPRGMQSTTTSVNRMQSTSRKSNCQIVREKTHPNFLFVNKIYVAIRTSTT